MALAFALQNGGKLRTDSSGNGSMFSFLNNISRRQMAYGKMERRNSVVSRHQPSNSQLPTLSHLHIEEISRGAQKLNQILRACSNGINFDRYSIEIGRELLKGAMDLEESLRMLVNLQETSEYLITPQRKSRLTLLDEEEEEDENPVNMADQKQLDRPIFSFDRRSRNYSDIQEAARTDLKLRLAALAYSSELVTNSKHEKKVLAASNSHSHKRSVSYGPDIKTLTAFSEQNQSSSLLSKQEKSRIPNVIAKLMGLDDHPRNVDSKVTVAKESEKQKVGGMIIKECAQGSTKKAEQRTKASATQILSPVKQKATLASKSPLIQDKVTSEAGKTLISRNGSTKVAVHEKLPPRKDLEDTKLVTSLRKATIKLDKQESDVVQLNHNYGSRKEIQDKGRKQDSVKQRQQQSTERSEIKEPVFMDEMQQMIIYMNKRSEAPVTSQEKTDYSESMLHRENRYGNKLLLDNQQKLQNNHGFHQVHMLEKSELQERRRQSEEREQKSTKQKFQGKKQKGNEPISGNFSKQIPGVTNLQKKQPQINQPATSRKGSTEHIDATQLNGFRDVRHNENPAGDRSSTNLNFKVKDYLNRNSSYSQGDLESESAKARIRFAVDEKPVQVQTKMKVRSTKGHKLDVPRTNEVVTKKVASVYNVPRMLKDQSSILQERQHTRQEKLAISREADKMKASGLKDVEAEIMSSNKSVASLQSSSVVQGMQKAAEQSPVSCSPPEVECKSLNEPQALVPKDSGQSRVPVVTKEQQEKEPDFGRAGKGTFKNSVSDPLHGNHEESIEISHTPQPQNQITTNTSEMPESLSETENHLKQILMKSQLFINTAEALFKVNISLSILHENGHDYHDQESKLILDCGYDVMKRKGRRQELSALPFLKLPITSSKTKSMDDLVKQMCKDFDKLKLYGRDGKEDSPFEDYLPKMLEADVNNKEPDVNCMWDLGWSCMMLAFIEKDDVIRDVEKYVLNGLLDEITIDLFTATSVSV
ncbi:hypothetical protein PTKIN_Ptkin09bG0121300 [Pterospermum kingtungense]